MTAAIPTRTIQLQPWLKTGDVEACFPTDGGGALILKDRGRILLDETLAVITLHDRPDIDWGWTHAQRLPGGGYALASSRSVVGKKNLQLFDDRGNLVTRFPAGDAIEHMAVDDQGRIWVGYFDEGIFGHDPLSYAGLSRFSETGRLDYQWDYSTHGPILDCYALTLDGAGRAWLCPYTEFFVAAITDDDVRIVMSEAPVSLAQGLLVSATHLGFVGGMDLPRDGGTVIGWSIDGTATHLPPTPEDLSETTKESVVTIVDLQTGAQTQVQLLDEYAAPLAFHNRVNCRAGTAACWTKDAIYRFKLENLVSAAAVAPSSPRG
ncbi:hypothetical protein [Sphingomonas sanxanigenens]|uniref:SMP-30/Gluconolactonase/LRE-like region domain-containing protein n=1 Tax=Sphingomonas sanxanigenens DSM 19645 = NX02 TaxID=1123269 RepID=W0AMF5_9SPHN|nr:hypothetical protein [Sphingomonas sanxanigenens]AHE57483.1 hypothetical protein NX02_29600 [Sphingomonas sanxanigenens DSM 19645 = NX02]